MKNQCDELLLCVAGAVDTGGSGDYARTISSRRMARCVCSSQLAYPRANARDFGKSIPEPYRDGRPVVHCFRSIENGFLEVSVVRFLLPVERGRQSDVHELSRRTTPRLDSPNAAVRAREL